MSPLDIAAAVAEEITSGNTGIKVRYVASDEPTCNEVAQALGAAIGKPDLQWIVIPDEQLLQGLNAAGMNPQIAEGYVKMNAAMHSGVLFEDYYRNKPALGKIKIADFAKDLQLPLRNDKIYHEQEHSSQANLPDLAGDLSAHHRSLPADGRFPAAIPGAAKNFDLNADRRAGDGLSHPAFLHEGL